MNLGAIFQSTTMVSAVLVIILILLQQRGASLGAGFSGSGELNTKRRGLEKSLFVTTIVFTVIFIVSIVALLLIPE
ncbi:preprotein translocase subunit SecG [Candidatus Saccharibacteria bacterium]|nr:preprotein translocase subunit SecG [Candidatus Saccharibacteria bacterium]